MSTGLLHYRLSPLEDFYHRFRVKKEGFLLILQSVEPLLPQYRKQTNSLEPDAAVFSVAQRFLPLVISRSLVVTSQSTVCRLVHRVTNAIASLSSQEIVFPDNTSQLMVFRILWVAVSGVKVGLQVVRVC